LTKQFIDARNNFQQLFSVLQVKVARLKLI